MKRKRRDSVFNRITEFAAKYPKVWIVLKGVLTICPTFVVTYVAVSWTLIPPPGQGFLRGLMTGHYWLAIILISIPIATPHLFAFIDCAVAKSSQPDDSPGLILTALLNSLNILVGTKLQRFREFYASMSDSVPKGEVFQRITQPGEQFRSILTTLESVLKISASEENFQLVLVNIKNGLPSEFIARCPANLQLEPTLVNQNAARSFFHYCAREKEPKVLNDIATHLKNTSKNPNKRYYYATGNSDDDRGSIIGYPFFCEVTGKVEYVLTIKTANANFFKNRFRQDYELPIDAIRTRVLLEHHLLLIKQKAI